MERPRSRVCSRQRLSSVSIRSGGGPTRFRSAARGDLAREIDRNGRVIEHAFFVGVDPALAQLFGAVLPGGPSVRTSQAATLFATVR